MLTPEEREVKRVSSARYRQKYPERVKAARAAAYAKEKVNRSPEYLRRKRETAWRQQGIDMTHAEYDAAYIAQAGVCAICGVHKNVLCVDHDHLTGATRGLLCHSCNTGLGLLGDSLKAAKAAVAYLERF